MLTFSSERCPNVCFWKKNNFDTNTTSQMKYGRRLHDYLPKNTERTDRFFLESATVVMRRFHSSALREPVLHKNRELDRRTVIIVYKYYGWFSTITYLTQDPERSLQTKYTKNTKD